MPGHGGSEDQRASTRGSGWQYTAPLYARVSWRQWQRLQNARGWSAASLVSLLSSVISLVFLIPTIRVTRPRFIQLYREMLPREPLPPLTNVFLCSTQLYSLLFTVVISILVIKEKHVQPASKRFYINISSFFVCMLLWIVYLYAMFLPLMPHLHRL